MVVGQAAAVQPSPIEAGPRQLGPGERHAGEVGTGERGVVQRGVGEVAGHAHGVVEMSTGERCPGEVEAAGLAGVAGHHGTGEVDVLQIGGGVEGLRVAVEVGIRKDGVRRPHPGEVGVHATGTGELGKRQVGADELRPAHVGVDEAGALQVGVGPRQVGRGMTTLSREVGSLEGRSGGADVGEGGSVQVGEAEVRFGQRRAVELAAGEVDWLAQEAHSREVHVVQVGASQGRTVDRRDGDLEPDVRHVHVGGQQLTERGDRDWGWVVRERAGPDLTSATSATTSTVPAPFGLIAVHCVALEHWTSVASRSPKWTMG